MGIETEAEFENLSTYDKIIHIYEKINSRINEIYKQIDSGAESEFFDELSILIDIETEPHKKQLPNLFDDLYMQSEDNNIYYFDCKSSVYKAHFEKRFENYKIEVPEGSELDFLKSEVLYFTNPETNRVIKGDYNYHEFIPYNDRYKITLRHKLDFLQKKLIKYNYLLSYTEDLYSGQSEDGEAIKSTSITLRYIKSKPQESINKDKRQSELSATKQLTTNQIVLLLSQVGFFDIQIIANAPKTKQAQLISEITGLNHKNIKIAIEKLDKKPSELGENYQKDIDKIKHIYNNLE